MGVLLAVFRQILLHRNIRKMHVEKLVTGVSRDIEHLVVQAKPAPFNSDMDDADRCRIEGSLHGGGTAQMRDQRNGQCNCQYR